jgi:hypothetical protein
MIVQTLEYVCDLCDKHAREQIELTATLADAPLRTGILGLPGLPGVTIPAGWKYVGHQLLCGLHQVVIDPRPESV